MIEIRKTGEGYSCEATPPHTTQRWKIDVPLDVRTLSTKLRDARAHPTDIGDAFYVIDPNWTDNLA